MVVHQLAELATLDHEPFEIAIQPVQQFFRIQP
jgi:hypothetical protein